MCREQHGVRVLMLDRTQGRCSASAPTSPPASAGGLRGEDGQGAAVGEVVINAHGAGRCGTVVEVARRVRLAHAAAVHSAGARARARAPTPQCPPFRRLGRRRAPRPRILWVAPLICGSLRGTPRISAARRVVGMRADLTKRLLLRLNKVQWLRVCPGSSCLAGWSRGLTRCAARLLPARSCSVAVGDG